MIFLLRVLRASVVRSYKTFLHPRSSAFICGFILFFLTACAAAPFSPELIASALPAGATVTAGPPTATPLPSATPFPTLTSTLTLTPSETPQPLPTLAVSSTPTLTLTATPDLRLDPADWQEWPVIPALSERARQVLREGIARGNNPRAFAKVGDCETITDWFLVDFDKGARYYNLGPYIGLQPVIDFFAGSFQRKSAASMRGFTAASALSPIWADPNQCRAGETPLGCEYRLQRPVLAFIMLGTNDVNHLATFEANLRKVLDQTLALGILPVMATKADNLEGDHQINRTMAELAYEYDIPLWNFWKAVQPLPGHGLAEDKAHLTYLPNRFDNPDALETAWPLRNLNALQILEAVMQIVKSN